MEFTFYICGIISILATLRVITHTHPVHALLYLIVSLLAISGVLFSLGAYFAGALEIIIYTGAILVLFVFVMMMLNLQGSEIKKERSLVRLPQCISSAFLLLALLLMIAYAVTIDLDNQNINGTPVLSKEVGVALFGPYIFAVEIVSVLLLSGIIISFHFSREEYTNKISESITANHNVKRKME